MKNYITNYDQYKYKEFFAAATEFDAPQSAVDRLGQWLAHFDPGSWNGECYDAGGGVRVFPVYGNEDENGCFPLLRYEIK